MGGGADISSSLEEKNLAPEGDLREMYSESRKRIWPQRRTQLLDIPCTEVVEES